MKKIVLFAIPMVALIALAWTHASRTDLRAVDGDPAAAGSGVVVLTVNGEPVSAEQFGAAVESLGGMQRVAAETSFGRKAVADQLVRQKLLAQEARRRNLATSASVLGRIAMAEDQILAESVLDALGEESSISDAELVEILRGELETAAISQIVVEASSFEEAERKAAEIRSRLEAGEEFEDLVEELSIMADNAGELGQVTREQLPPSIRDAVFSTETGGVTRPVALGSSYHIYLVKERKFPEEAMLRAQIEQSPVTARIRANISRLEKAAEVELNEQWLENPSG